MSTCALNPCRLAVLLKMRNIAQLHVKGHCTEQLAWNGITTDVVQHWPIREKENWTMFEMFQCSMFSVLTMSFFLIATIMMWLCCTYWLSLEMTLMLSTQTNMEIWFEIRNSRFEIRYQRDQDCNTTNHTLSPSLRHEEHLRYDAKLGPCISCITIQFASSAILGDLRCLSNMNGTRYMSCCIYATIQRQLAQKTWEIDPTI